MPWRPPICPPRPTDGRGRCPGASSPPQTGGLAHQPGQLAPGAVRPFRRVARRLSGGAAADQPPHSPAWALRRVPQLYKKYVVVQSRALHGTEQNRFFVQFAPGSGGPSWPLPACPAPASPGGLPWCAAALSGPLPGRVRPAAIRRPGTLARPAGPWYGAALPGCLAALRRGLLWWARRAGVWWAVLASARVSYIDRRASWGPQGGRSPPIKQRGPRWGAPAPVRRGPFGPWCGGVGAAGAGRRHTRGIMIQFPRRPGGRKIQVRPS